MNVPVGVQTGTENTRLRIRPSINQESLMEPDSNANTDHQEPLEDLTLHPEFVRIEDGSRVVLLREDEFVPMVAALRQYEALQDHIGGDPLVNAR